MKINWKKLVLGAGVTVLALALFIVGGFFVWMQTWKTYEFPDGSGSIKYPSQWKLERSDHSLKGCYEQDFGTIYSAKEQLSDNDPLRDIVLEFVCFPFDQLHYSSLEDQVYDSASRVRGKSYVFRISSVKVYAIKDEGYGYYSYAHNGNQYGFDSFFLKSRKGLDRIVNEFVLGLMISTLKVQ